MRGDAQLFNSTISHRELLARFIHLFMNNAIASGEEYADVAYTSCT